MVGKVRSIKFNEELHRYTDEENLVYTSVTTVIGKYHKQFDEKFWANKKAEDTSIYNPYRGMSEDQIKQQWKEGREFSCEKGNKTHKLLEDSINASNGKANFDFEKKLKIGMGSGVIVINKTNLHILANTPLATKYPKIYAFLRKYIEDGWTLYAEKRIYWWEFLIAGTIDCLLLKGNFFMIVDWKTNKKKLEFRSGYYKKHNGIETSQWVQTNETFFPPLTNIPYCKGNTYTLQLSLYAYLLELWGYKCVGLTLFHILQDQVQEPINISYVRSDCEKLCMDWISRSSINNNTNNSNNGAIKFGIFKS
jgi:ATP-dependent exoDNAse (exonuclease V) beta subunit